MIWMFVSLVIVAQSKNLLAFGFYHRLPASCKEIWENSRIRVDGPFYIRADPPAKYANVFCHMTPIPGCGDGGWTLVMKINGSKQTFTFSSKYWNNTIAYDEAAGTTLVDAETKLSSFWSTPFNRLCLGMKDLRKADEGTNWIAVNYKGSSLRDIIGNGTFQATNVNSTQWLKLLNNSKIMDGCQWQGFNSINEKFENGPRARIGIIGAPKHCNQTAESRIGFGTSGNFFGMDDSNTCGNEFKEENSIKAFGYIFVQ